MGENFFFSSPFFSLSLFSRLDPLHLLATDVALDEAPFAVGVPAWLAGFSFSALRILLYIVSNCDAGGLGSRGQNPAT